MFYSAYTNQYYNSRYERDLAEAKAKREVILSTPITPRNTVFRHRRQPVTTVTTDEVADEWGNRTITTTTRRVDEYGRTTTTQDVKVIPARRSRYERYDRADSDALVGVAVATAGLAALGFVLFGDD